MPSPPVVSPGLEAQAAQGAVVTVPGGVQGMMDTALYALVWLTRWGGQSQLGLDDPSWRSFATSVILWLCEASVPATPGRLFLGGNFGLW